MDDSTPNCMSLMLDQEMAERYTEQNCDNDEPYETVVFRNSMIVYPAELATNFSNNTNPNVSLASTTSPECSTDCNGEQSKPRQSVLNEFDPIAQNDRKLSWHRLDAEWKVLVNPQNVTCTESVNEVALPCRESSESPPPPIPPRGKPQREPHPYDLVSFEDHVPFNRPLPQTQLPSDAPISPRKVSIKGVKAVRSLLDKVARTPSRTQQPSAPSEIHQGGPLRWNNSGKVQTVHTVMKNGYLCYSDAKSNSLKYLEPLNKIVTIGISTEDRGSSEGEVHWFEVVSTHDKRKTTVLGASSLAERMKWMSGILFHGAPTLQETIVGDFERAGKVYIKEGISGNWQTVWILVQSFRSLWRLTVSPNSGALPQCEDLRKIRSISLTQLGDEGGCYLAVEAGPVVVIDWPDLSLYIQADLRRETESWNRILRERALYSGSTLDDQQLTAEDVPVLVERCVRFISSHGILSEGIYRKSGVSSKIQKLLEQLKYDAWNVRISIDDYNEHDVSNVLKRFFRTLPEPLLTNEHYSHWIDACAIENRDERLKLLTVLLRALPPINYQTLKRLLGHLHAVHDQCEKNLMPAGNLASVLGPTLMTVGSYRDMATSFSHTGAETDVLLQLIQNYPWLFGVDPETLQQERDLAKAVERIQCANIPRKVDGGNMIVWVHYGPEANNEVSITVWPSRTAREVVGEVAERIIPVAESSQNKCYMLMEYVCGDTMKRPIAFNDPVLPIILSWLDWPEEDRRHNRLVFCQDDSFVNIFRNVVTPRSMFVEVRYTDSRSKHFRKCPFEFCQARLTFLKDCKNHAVQGRYDLESVTWYIGGDAKRSPPTQWVISFIEKSIPLKRTKETPYLGHSISFTTENEYNQFIMSLVAAQFSEGLRNFVLRV